jgi:drug/metabolite transporter (DMT)-like permease
VLGLLLLARRGLSAPRGPDAAVLVGLGTLDVLANLAYAGAASEGGTAVVAVLGSLYPLTTVLLARALLGEQLDRGRWAGIAAVFGGIALISTSTG